MNIGSHSFVLNLNYYLFAKYYKSHTILCEIRKVIIFVSLLIMKNLRIKYENLNKVLKDKNKV